MGIFTFAPFNMYPHLGAWYPIFYTVIIVIIIIIIIIIIIFILRGDRPATTDLRNYNNSGQC